MTEKQVWMKLGLRAGTTLLVVGAPDGYIEMLGDMPEDIQVAESTAVAPEAIHLFVRTLPEMDDALTDLRPLVTPDTLVWLSYPKGRPKDEINRDSIWERLGAHALRPVSQVSIDPEWSALRLRPL